MGRGSAFLVVLQYLVPAIATGAPGAANTSRHYLLRLINSSRHPAATDEIDCAWRQLAFSFVPTILSNRLYRDAAEQRLATALQLAEFCGNGSTQRSSMRPNGQGSSSAAFQGTAQVTIFVSARSGDDGAAGTLVAPLRTLHAAVHLLRAKRGNASPLKPATIVLRGGTHRINGEPIVLHHTDSFLTIEAYKDEAAIVSGAVLLSALQWAKSASPATAHVVTLTPGQAAGLPSLAIPALRVHGKRATRARYPNANPELDLFPKGYIHTKTTWLPPVYPPYNAPESRPCDPRRQCGRSTNVTLAAPASEWHGMYQDYAIGYGGACEAFDPPQSPWCSGDFYLMRQFPEMHTRSPSGILAAPHLPNAPYKDATGAHIIAWRPHHWYTWMWEVSKESIGPVANATAFFFGRGGNQGGEGADYADEWWIENVAEELDAPNEYFYDKSSRQLRLIYNGTGKDATPPAQVDVPSLTNLFELRGSRDAPLINVTFRGVTFRDTMPSYLAPRGNPSGGDWALERLGAIFVEGAEHVRIEACTFTHLDSNAVFLSGYTRGTIIRDSEFSWLGQGMPAWKNS